MKRLLLWLIGVALGVVVLLAAVLGVSYSFTSEGAKPASEVQFAGQELEPNGWCWQVPLLGGQIKSSPAPAPSRCRSLASSTTPTRPLPCRTGTATAP